MTQLELPLPGEAPADPQLQQRYDELAAEHESAKRLIGELRNQLAMANTALSGIGMLLQGLRKGGGSGN